MPEKLPNHESIAQPKEETVKAGDKPKAEKEPQVVAAAPTEIKETKKEVKLEATETKEGRVFHIGPEASEEEFKAMGLEITRALLDDEKKWKELVEDGEEKILETARELWSEKGIAVHGIAKRIRKKKEVEIEEFALTDLDGKASLELWKQAGIKPKEIAYIPQGTLHEGKINLDTSGESGVILKIEKPKGGNKKEVVTVILDHHQEEAGVTTSTTELSYRLLTAMGFLKKEETLDRLVEFVTQKDNKTFPDEEKYFNDSYRTLLGLHRFLKPDTLFEFYKAGRSPTELLTEDDFKKLGVIETVKDKTGKETVVNHSEEQKKAIEASMAALQEMEKNGLIIDTFEYGKIAIDLDKKIPAGTDAAYAYGCDTYLLWSPKTQSFFISSKKPLDFTLEQGKKVRGNMIVKPIHEEEPLEITLGDVLEKMAGRQLVGHEAKGELRNFLNRECLGYVVEIDQDEKEIAVGDVLKREPTLYELLKTAESAVEMEINMHAFTKGEVTKETSEEYRLVKVYEKLVSALSGETEKLEEEKEFKRSAQIIDRMVGIERLFDAVQAFKLGGQEQEKKEDNKKAKSEELSEAKLPKADEVERKAETIERKISPEERTLEEKRAAYLKEYQEHLKETRWQRRGEKVEGVWKKLRKKEPEIEELPPTLKLAKAEYDRAKIEYGQKLMREKEHSLIKESFGDRLPTQVERAILNEKLKEYRATELFKKLVIDERTHLHAQQVEGWPPEKKGVFRRALEWWSKQNKYARLIPSTILATGIFAGLSGGWFAVGVPSVALFAGSRIVRGFLSALGAQAAGKGVELAYKWSDVEKEVEEKKQVAQANLYTALSEDALREAESEYQKATERLAKLRSRKFIIKTIAMLGAGGLSLLGAGKLEEVIAETKTPKLGLERLDKLANEFSAKTGREPTTKELSWLYAGEVKGGLSLEEREEIFNLAKGKAALSENEIIEIIKKPGKAVLEELKPPAGKEATAAIPPAAEEAERLRELATIHKGKGAWHAVYRQLEDRLYQNPRQFGLYPDELTDSAKVKEVLNQATGRILVEQGYIKPDGTEIRILKPGTKVILEPDNKIKLEGEGPTLVYEWHKPKEVAIEIPMSEKIPETYPPPISKLSPPEIELPSPKPILPPESDIQKPQFEPIPKEPLGVERGEPPALGLEAKPTLSIEAKLWEAFDPGRWEEYFAPENASETLRYLDGLRKAIAANDAFTEDIVKKLFQKFPALPSQMLKHQFEAFKSNLDNICRSMRTGASLEIATKQFTIEVLRAAEEVSKEWLRRLPKQ